MFLLLSGKGLAVIFGVGLLSGVLVVHFLVPLGKRLLSKAFSKAGAALDSASKKV